MTKHKEYVVKTKRKQEWNELQIYCYQRNCNCEGCRISGMGLSTPCQMKKAIIEHIKLHGLPKDIETKGIIDD